MGIRTPSAIAIAAALLSGCVTPDMSTWSPEQIAAYKQSEEEAYQQIMQRANRAPAFQIPAPMQTPQIGPYNQPNSTAVVYCTDVSANVTTCRQVR